MFVESPPERVKPSLEIRKLDNNSLVVSIKPPEGPFSVKSCNLDLLVVISINDSMLQELTESSPTYGVLHNSGISYPTALEVLKHTLRSVIDYLTPDDRLGILYTTQENHFAKLQFMNDGHKEWSRRAINEITTLEYDDTEDLMAQFRRYFDQTPRVRPVRAALFFTNKGGPASYPEKALRKLSSQIKCCPRPFTVHTFGYGPAVDSRLLLTMANAGWGSYTYVPTADLMPSLIFQTIAGLRSTFATFARLQYYHGKEAKQSVGKCQFRPADTSVEYAAYNRGGRTRDISVGSLLFGHERRILMEFNENSAIPLPANVTLCYRDNLQESPFAVINLWETVRIDIGQPNDIVEERPSRSQYPTFKTALCNTLANILSFSPSFESQTAATFSPERFEAGMGIIQLQLEADFPSPTLDPKDLPSDMSELFNDITHEFECTFHTESMIRDLTKLPTALFEKVRLRLDEWSTFGEHVTASRLCLYRNEIFCSYQEVFAILQNMRLPPAFRNTLNNLYCLFKGPAPYAPFTRDSTVGVHKSSRILTVDEAGNISMRPISEIVRGGCANVVTPLGPRRVVAFLAARFDAFTSRITKLPTSTKPVMFLTPSMDGVITYQFDNGNGFLASESQPVALEGEVFHLPLYRQSASFAWIPGDEDKDWVFQHLWLLLLEPDPAPEAHVVYIEGYRVMTVGHFGLSGCGQHETLFGDYNKVLLSLCRLERMPEYALNSYVINGIRHDATGLVCDLY